jgi:hypothetical protein
MTTRQGQWTEEKVSIKRAEQHLARQNAQNTLAQESWMG